MREAFVSPRLLKARTVLFSGIALVAVSLFVIGLNQQPASAQATDSAFNQNRAFLEDEQNTIGIVQAVGNSVVAIRVESPSTGIGNMLGDVPLDQIPPQFRDFFNLPPAGEEDQEGEVPQGRPDIGSGSGFVINTDGHIITNYHVIESAIGEESVELVEGAALSVIFPNTNDEAVDVRVVGANPSFDLALLALVDPTELPEDVLPIVIADSNEVLVGQKVIAIGNPFGFASTVTTGIVSALDRDEIPTIGNFAASMIQTDAAINPGNSGGPLLNSRGELIGINTAIIPGGGAGTRGNLGVGFAVPSIHLTNNLSSLQAGGINDVFSTRPRIGIGILDVRVYPDDVRERLDYPERGVVIRTIEEDGPAAKAGLIGSTFSVMVDGQEIPAGGDVIVAIDGIDIFDTFQLQDLVFAHSPGDEVVVTALRDGERVDFTVKLEIVPTDR